MKRPMIAWATLVLAASAFGAACAQDGPAQALQPRDGRGGPMAAARMACRADAQKLCQGVQPGGGRIMQCMRDHRDALSEDCKAALMNARAHRRGGEGPAAMSSPQG